MSLPSAAELERVLLNAVDREPDSELVDRPDWVQIKTPSSPRPNHNIVLRAQLAPDEVDATVAAVVAEHRARDAKLRWFIGPSSSPAELGVAVQAAGLTPLGDTLGMAMLVPEVAPPLGIAGLTVHEMGPQDVGTFAALTARAWERGSDFEEALLHIAGKSFQEPRATRSWIASLDGVPVASSHLRLLPGIGYFQGCAVLPAYRGRGIYRALLHHRLGELRSRGIRVAVVWADATGSGIACLKLGFATVCTAQFYEAQDEQ